MAGIKCPKCNGQLIYYVKTYGTRGHKINKDGSLSKVTLRSVGTPTDIYFVECDKCGFIYNLSYGEDNATQYGHIDDWYEEYGELIE